MRGRLVWLAIALAAGLSGRLRAAELPYTVVVNGDDVYVRSGPGKDYYPTDKLRKGDRVEVYRRDPGGWLAIRPPEGSFSWVSARHLEKLSDGLAKVTDERVVARVGSSLGDQRDVIQVRLRKGETVELVDPPGKSGEQWLAIAPPAGEFRWVSGKFVTAEPRSPVKQADFTEPVEPQPAAEATPSDARPLAAPDEISAVAEPQQPPGDAAEEMFRPAHEWRTGGDPRQAERAAWQSRETTPPGRRSRLFQNLSQTETTPRAKELEQLDLKLSQIVGRDVSTWELDELRARADDLLAEAETPLERGRVRLLVRRIERFDELRARHGESTRGMFAGGRRFGRAPASRPATPASGEFSATTTTTQFDGMGRLEPVLSSSPTAPRFALVDTGGNVQTYLVAAPGVNLRLYQGQSIGVTGSRALLLDERRPLITVDRVTALAPPARQAARPYVLGQIQ